jgi:hypothetical protein
MGRIRKEHAITFDMSSTQAAPVSPGGAMRVRPKADGTTLQLSFNTGAYFDLGGGTGPGGFPRLDQVLNPDIAATEPPTQRVKTFAMLDHQLVFHFQNVEAEESFVIESLTPGTYGGALLLLRASGTASEKSPFRVEGRGAFYLSVTPSGKVAIGSETGLQSRLSVFHTNSGGVEQDLGAIQGTVTLATGNAATSVTAAVFGVSDNGNTTALSNATTLALVNSQSSLAPSNASRTLKLIDAGVYVASNTGLAQGLVLKPTVSNVAVLTAWEGIRVVAPNLVTGGTIDNNKAIVTETGALEFTLGESHVATIYKTTDSGETPQLDFKRKRATGLYLEHDDLAGRIMFYGWFNPAYKTLGYIQSTFDDDLYGPAGTMTMGVGDFGNARIAMLQTDAGAGGVTIWGDAATHYFQVQSAGFQFSHGTTGSIYYKDALGYFVNLDIFSHATDPDDEGKVLTVANVSGTLLPRWVVAPGASSSGLPDTPVGSLQFNDAGAFGGVTSSAVTGPDIQLGGILTLQAGAATAKQIVLNATSTNPTITLRGSSTQWGYIEAYYDGTYLGPRLDIGAGAINDLARITMLDTGAAGAITLWGGTFYFQVQSAGFQFSHGSTGSLYYRHSTGYFNATASPSSADNIPYWDNSEGHVGWLTVGSGLLITGTTPNQVLTASGGGTPELPHNSLQFNEAGSFGAVPSSVVSGADLTLGGILTLQAGAVTAKQIVLDATATSPIITLRGSSTQWGYIESWYDGTYGGPRLDLGAGAKNDMARITMLDTGASSAITLYGYTGIFFQVQSAGFQFSSGTNGSMYYRDSLGYFVPTASPASADNLPYWDNSLGVVGWLSVGAGLAITGTAPNQVLAATGGSVGAAGSPYQIQWNNAGSLDGVGGLEISATGGEPNLVLGGGYLQIAAGLTANVPDKNQEFFISATTAAPTRFVMRRYSSAAQTGPYIEFDRGRGTEALRSNLINEDVVGEIIFKGQIGGTLAQSGYIQSWYDGVYGGSRMDIGAGTGSLPTLSNMARITMLDTGASAAITLYGNDTFYFQVQTAGFQFSSGTTGSLYYRDSGGYFVPSPSPASADNIAFWDNSEGKINWLTVGSGLSISGASPSTQTLSASGGPGGSPAGTGSELQYRNAGAFGAVSTSGVTAAGWVGIGTTSPSVRFHVVGNTQLESAGFIFQVQSAGFYFSSGGTGALYYRDSFGYFVPTATPPAADRLAFWDTSANKVDWLTAGSGLTISGTTITASGGTPAGTGSELQYRNAGAFGAVASSSVDGSGNITLGSGALTVQGNATATLALKTAYASAGPTLYTERSRGTLTSKSGIFAGDALLTVSSYGYDSGVVLRQGVAMDFTAQATFTSTSAPTVLRLRTTPVNSLIPAGRMIVGACRTLANNTLTDLFTITYGAADQAAMAGEIHIVLVAKGAIVGGAHDGVNIFVHRRVISFAIAHNKNNDMQITFTEVQAHRAGGASDDTGLTAISHALNFDAAVGTGTNIPSTPNAYATNAITYKILATAVPNMTSITQLTCYYNIFYHGEGELAVAAS